MCKQTGHADAVNWITELARDGEIENGNARNWKGESDNFQLSCHQ